MLTLSEVGKSFGDRPLLAEASLQLNRGDRVGLVGPNGAGKSTLLDLILGVQQPDAGTISLDRRCSVGFLPQETADVRDETVLEISLSFKPELLPLRRALNDPNHALELDAHSSYAEHDGFQLEARAKQILTGLGFKEAQFERPARELSGGWIMRAHLARLLVQEPDLLLLDEPTNHLDLHSLLWFQAHLQEYPGGILMVSHDRAFLNQLVGSIVELRAGRLIQYRGNYDDFVIQREAAEANLLAGYKNQQKEIARLMLFVDRFRAKNTKASQAQSKLKQIDRMEKIQLPAGATQSIDFKFPQPPRSGHKVLKLAGVSFAYGSTPVYDGLDFEVERGQRLLLAGPNGAGKSTLLKLLGGVLSPDAGERVTGHNVRAGYYSQKRIDMLRLDRSVLEEALDTPQRITEQFVRTLLGCFLFSGEEVFKPVRVLSGGEKSRLALVKLLLDPPNCLLMDEPTTHLDMASIEALIYALKQYDGTLVFISHDVYFIRQVANFVTHVENGRVTPIAGNYDYYLEKMGGHRAIGLTGHRAADPRPKDRSANRGREQRKMEARERQEKAAQHRARRKLVTELEQEIFRLEQRQNEITRELQDPGLYANPQNAAGLNRELRSIASELPPLHARWEQAAADLEKHQQRERDSE